uniref:Thyroid adenoma-associated protein homolog n=1 Tax=Parastrongyloides trichosuri TaxID=131310 RepID=A0A0N4ZP58_PARTI
MMDIYELFNQIFQSKICPWSSDVQNLIKKRKKIMNEKRLNVDMNLLKNYLQFPEKASHEYSQVVIFQLILRYFEVSFNMEFYENNKSYLLVALFNETTKETFIKDDLYTFYYFLCRNILSLKAVEGFLKKVNSFSLNGKNSILELYMSLDNDTEGANTFLSDLILTLEKTYKYIIERWSNPETIQEMKRSFKLVLDLRVKFIQVPYEFFLQQFLSTVTWNIRFQYIVLPLMISPIQISSENNLLIEKLVNEIFERTTLNQFDREFASITCPSIVSIATIIQSSDSSKLKNDLYDYLYHMFTFQSKQVCTTACKLWIPRLIKIPKMQDVFKKLLKNIAKNFVELRSNYHNRNKEIHEYREETCIDHEGHIDTPHELTFKLDNLLYAWILIYNSLSFKDIIELPLLLITGLRYRTNFVVLEALNVFLNKGQKSPDFRIHLHEFFYNHMSTDDSQIRELMLKNVNKLELKVNDTLAKYINGFLFQDTTGLNYQRILICLSVLDYYPECYIGDGSAYVSSIGNNDNNIRLLSLKYILKNMNFILNDVFRTVLQYIDLERHIEVVEDVLKYGILKMDIFKNDKKKFEDYFDKIKDVIPINETFTCYLDSIVLQNYKIYNYEKIQLVAIKCMNIIENKMIQGGSLKLGHCPPLVELYENLKKPIIKNGMSNVEISSEFGIALISYSQGILYTCKTLFNLLELLIETDENKELICDILKSVRNSALRTRHKGINDSSCDVYKNCIKILSNSKKETFNLILKDAHTEFMEMLFNSQFEARNLAFWRICMIFVDEGLQCFDELISKVLRYTMPENISETSDNMKIRYLKLLKAFLSSSNYSLSKYYPELLRKLCCNFPLESYPVRSAMGHVFANLINEIFIGWPKYVPYFNFVLHFPELFCEAINQLYLLKDSINNQSLFFVLTIFERLVFVDDMYYDEDMLQVIYILKGIFIRMLEKAQNYFIRDQLINALFNLIKTKNRKNLIEKLESFLKKTDNNNFKMSFNSLLGQIKQSYPYQYPNPKFSNVFSSSFPLYDSICNETKEMSEVSFIFLNATSFSERLRLHAAYKVIALAQKLPLLEKKIQLKILLYLGVLLMDEIEFIRIICCEFGTTTAYPSMDNTRRILSKLGKLIKQLALPVEEVNNIINEFLEKEEEKIIRYNKYFEPLILRSLSDSI